MNVGKIALVKRENRALVFFLAAAFLATWLARNNPFFWDTVQLASKHAHHFYETGFQSLILPAEIDSGHPPFFGMYIAWVWAVFGKTLPASHFAMLPFLWGIIFFLFRIGGILTKGVSGGAKYAPLLAVLCFADPVLASQSILVSPDVALVFFFLMAVWSIWEQRSVGWLAVAIAGLGMVSMRGMMLGLGLYFFVLCQTMSLAWPTILKKMAPFFPGGFLAMAFLAYHWLETGWIGFHADSSWAPSFERAGFSGFLKNLAVLGWRFLDFGRVFVWTAFLVSGIMVWKRARGTFPLRFFNKKWLKESLSSTTGQLVLLVIISFLALVPSQLPYKGLLAHRYLLPVFLSLNFLLFHLVLVEFNLRKTGKTLLLMVVSGLATGNLWVYPKGVSMGWDSTLAHLPWYFLGDKMEGQIVQKNISMEQIGTAFPNIGPREIFSLNGVGEGFSPKDLNSHCYVLYSNVMNDFTDEEMATLQENWIKISYMEKGGVCMVLFKNPESSKCEN